MNIDAGRQLATEKPAQPCEGLPCAFPKLDLGVDLGRLCPVKGTEKSVTLGIGAIIPCLEFPNQRP